MLQEIVAAIIITLALAFAVRLIVQKVRSFSAKPECDVDCGCNAGNKNLTS